MNETPKWILWWFRTGKLLIPIDEYDMLIQCTLDVELFKTEITMPALDLVRDWRTALDAAVPGSVRAGQLREAHDRAQKEAEVLVKLGAAVQKFHTALGPEQAIELLRALSIGKRTRQKAFQSATKSLQNKKDGQSQIYTIEGPRVRGADAANNRILIRMDKVEAGDSREDPDFGVVARFVFNPEDPEDPVTCTLVDDRDKYAADCCAKLPQMVYEEVEGGSANMFKTAVENMEEKLDKVPVDTNAHMYACHYKHAPVVEFLTELITWVGLKYRHPKADSKFKPKVTNLDLFDVPKDRDLISTGVKEKLGDWLSDLDKRMVDLEAAKEAQKEDEIPQAVSESIRKEVLEAQNLIRVYQNELSTTASVMAKRYGVLMGRYRKFADLD